MGGYLYGIGRYSYFMYIFLLRVLVWMSCYGIGYVLERYGRPSLYFFNDIRVVPLLLLKGRCAGAMGWYGWVGCVLPPGGYGGVGVLGVGE